jgi:hypothetical protein
MSGRGSEDCAEFGVLYVAGFAEQRPVGAVAAFAGALYRWLYRWNSRPHVWPASPPTLRDTVLSGDQGTADERAPDVVGSVAPEHG